jgi:thiol-disulfide isomerase/thioredoxin
LAACSGGETASNETIGEQEPTPINEPAPTLPEEPGFQAPLTGVKMNTDITDRPVAVMINNLDKARPQSGLTHADVMWEVLAEGGITRLIAVFQSDSFADPIGPIRSIRPYLIELAEFYQSVIVHAGGSTDAYDILQHQNKQHLDEITNAGSYFWRDKSRKAPHNLYSDLTKLRAGAAKKGYEAIVPIPAFSYMDAPVAPAGTDAANIAINFLLKNYKVSYAYNSEKLIYSRSINGKPHTDMNNSEQLTASNLVVIGAKHKVLDKVGRISVDLASGGPAILFQLGKAVECEWERDESGMIRIKKDGQELPFVRGKTYYHIVPMEPTFAGHIVYGLGE